MCGVMAQNVLKSISELNMSWDNVCSPKTLRTFGEYTWNMQLLMAAEGNMLKKGGPIPSTFEDAYPYDTIDDSSILHHFASYLTHLSFMYLRPLGF